jgi:hypothetical protein
VQFYQGQAQADGSFSTAGYSVDDAGHDAWIALTTDEKCGKATPNPYNAVHRREGARVARFWRRFDKSLLRARLKEIPDESERLGAFNRFMHSYRGRLPSSQEMMVMDQLISQVKWESGNMTPGLAIEIAAMVSRALPMIPNAVFDIIGDRRSVEYRESDDECDDLEVITASWSEVMPRERFGTPKMLRLEKRARGALTRWQWLEAHAETDKAHVEFLVDSSGSMGANKFAVAIAAAIKLGEMFKDQGHQVSMRFVANKMSDRMTPEQAIGYAATRERKYLGGGDDFGMRLRQAAAQEHGVTDFVVVSDFEIDMHDAENPCGEDGHVRSVRVDQTMHAVFLEDDTRCDPMHADWWKWSKTKFNWSGMPGEL